MLIGTGTVKYLAYQTQDVDRRDDNTAAGDHGPRAMEHVGMLEGTVEDGHLGHKAAQARQTQVGQTGNDIADGEERHNLHQARQLADVAGVRPSVNHTDEGKEEGRHQAVAQHLEHGTRTGRLVHHQDGEEHQAAVAHRGVGVDVFQVSLYAGREGTIDNRNTCQYQEYPAQLIGSFGHQIHGDAEATVASQLHQYACMKHGYSRRCRSMTVRAPRMEGEQGAQHAKSQEGEWEPDALLFNRYVVQGGYFGEIHCSGAAAVVDTQDTYQQEG